jgi:putative FmdB family regulatory protein
MPTYEYACASCHRHTEAQQSFTDPPLTECPHCGGRLKRVFHPVGIVLKGSGFYSTDNRSSRKGATETPGKETTTDAKETKEAPAKTETDTKPSKESAASKDTQSKPAKKAKT